MPNMCFVHVKQYLGKRLHESLKVLQISVNFYRQKQWQPAPCNFLNC